MTRILFMGPEGRLWSTPRSPGPDDPNPPIPREGETVRWSFRQWRVVQVTHDWAAVQGSNGMYACCMGVEVRVEPYDPAHDPAAVRCHPPEHQ